MSLFSCFQIIFKAIQNLEDDSLYIKAYYNDSNVIVDIKEIVVKDFSEVRQSQEMEVEVKEEKTSKARPADDEMDDYDVIKVRFPRYYSINVVQKSKTKYQIQLMNIFGRKILK